MPVKRPSGLPSARPRNSKPNASVVERYQQAADDLAGAVAEFPAIAFEGDAPAVDAEDSKGGIQEINEHFAALKATALAKAREVLGEQFNPEDKKARDDLEASIRPAIEQLSKHLSELPSIARLSALSASADEIAVVARLLAQIDAEAATLAALAASPDRARRAQLYARLSAWMHEHGHADDGMCPVCVGPLHGECDPVTGNTVSDHLAEATRDREVIARTVAECRRTGAVASSKIFRLPSRRKPAATCQGHPSTY
ncbi:MULTISPECIES: hypothetical protein [Bradyrhizobium]|uniref:hypothetical protein n=1 Tax=Bradyrhizobium TaxID=374 RepID=UPI001EDB7BA0|nr:hypothetical protein [Bradyrhizobium zhengyangense]MCG2644976.1 hypothetical protein [Bradyrhizobium zhengyangense]